jgi:hypothetical protein
MTITVEEAHSNYSNLRESIVEHLFVGNILRLLWNRRLFDVEVSHSEFDGFGYDLVIELHGIVRHIQLKSTRIVGKKKEPRSVNISEGLEQKPGGCVIWIGVNDELALGPFYWLGGPPTSPLPPLEKFRYAKRIGRKKSGERPLRKRHRVVPKSAFTKLNDLEAVLDELFGPTS